MSGSQWMRRYRILVEKKSGGVAWEMTNLQCVFSIEKATKDTPNYAQIAIYNLSYDTETEIVKNGKNVIVEAGYVNGNYGLIYYGKIIQPLRMKADVTTRTLVLICQDGDQYLNNHFTAGTLSAGVTQSDVVNVLTGNADISLGNITSVLSEKSSIRGKVLFGASASYLSSIAKSAGAQMYVEDNTVNIVAAEDYGSNTAVELNPLTGLIDTPEQTDDGVKCKCLINPSIKLNTYIYINAELIRMQQVEEKSTTYKQLNADGIYRVFSIKTVGDTRGDDWYMEIEATAQSGKKPEGIVDDTENYWR